MAAIRNAGPVNGVKTDDVFADQVGDRRANMPALFVIRAADGAEVAVSASNQT